MDRGPFGMKSGCQNFKAQLTDNKIYDPIKNVQRKKIQMANKHMKRCLASLAIGEMQIKTSGKSHLLSTRMAIFKKPREIISVEKPEPLCMAGGNVNGTKMWVTIWQVHKRLNTEWPCGPATPFLDMYPKCWRRCLYAHVHSSRIHNSQEVEQPKCPLTGEWINEMCIHAEEYYSALKRKENLTHTPTWMNPEDITLSEISQTQTDKHCMTPLL